MRDDQGFTLIELLIVVVIVGILAAIAIPKLSTTREATYFAAMKSDLQSLANQQEIYFAETSEYTPSTTSLDFVASEGVTVTIAASADGWSASSTHAALAATEGCSIYYGSGTALTVGTVTPKSPGEVACTQ